MDIDTYQELGLHLNFGDAHGDVAVNGRRNSEVLSALDTPGDAVYHPCAEAQPNSTVTESDVAHFTDWRSREVYPETSRDLWIVAPPDVGPQDNPSLLVFNDGGLYLNPEGPVRAQRVLEGLRAAGSLGPAVGVFVSPGRPLDVPPAGSPWEMNSDPGARRQRSVEYDSMTTRYSSFLVDEIIPFVQTHLGLALHPNPTRRALVGVSSGGICAWTAAWHRPDNFGLVLSHCGSFVNIRGGHCWPYLIRSSERRPIRAYLQSGINDANIIYGNWPLANQQMASALEFAGYDVRFEFGTGGHSLRHGGALFADSLRWLVNGQLA